MQRCSGTCHQGNKYHNCIPTRTTIVQKKVRACLPAYVRKEGGHLLSAPSSLARSLAVFLALPSGIGEKGTLILRSSPS